MSNAGFINGDLAHRAVVETQAMEWAPSPSGTVWRKRVHLVGPPESGQVTSVVRYEPDSRFPSHDHPEGEEILVLSGVFSDEHGDWPAGTYLLNPEGFRHAPYSRDGCMLLVKLRQFPGRDRKHVAVGVDTLAWQATATKGVESKSLYTQIGYQDTMRLERWAADADAGTRAAPGGLEYFVLEGTLVDEQGSYPSGTWLRLPAGSSHRPRSNSGCLVYVKAGGAHYLRDGADLEAQT